MGVFISREEKKKKVLGVKREEGNSSHPSRPGVWPQVEGKGEKKKKAACINSDRREGGGANRTH